MTKVAVIFHSGFGHTARQAAAVFEGAGSVAGVEALLLPVAEAERRWTDIEAADALVFGCPTYMGSGSAPFKAFMDASAKVWMRGGWKDKVAAGFTNSGSLSGDKLSTLTQLALFAAQHGMIWVGVELPSGQNSSKGRPDNLNRLGGWLGAMAQSNVDEGADKGPSTSDLETARHLGRRVATIAGRFRPAAIGN